MFTSRGHAFSAFVFSGLLFAATVSAQAPVKVGAELQVNSYTTEGQTHASIGLDANGGFVLAWASYLQDGSNTGIFGRRFTSLGLPVGVEFQVHTYTTGYQLHPAIGASAAGSFAVVWDRDDGSDTGVFGQRFGANGLPIGKEFVVNSYTGKAQQYPAIGMNASGAFVVTWESTDQESLGDTGIFARRFDSSGAALAAEFQVNDYTTGDQRQPAAAINDDGEIVIGWTSVGQDGSQDGVFARRFFSTGSPIDPAFQVSTATADLQNRVSVAIADDEDARFVVTWQTFNQADPGFAVRARAFVQGSIPTTPEIAVNQFGLGEQQLARVAIEPSGDFVVAWQGGGGQDGADNGIFARAFTSAGLATSDEFQVNSFTLLSQQFPALAARDDGDFVVAWDSGHDGDPPGVFAQRLAVPATLDVDGNGVSDPLTDGLLVLRFLFGFNGTSLTLGAVGQQCTRCDAAAIEAYLQPLT